MADLSLTIVAADIPQVRAELERLREENERLGALLSLARAMLRTAEWVAGRRGECPWCSMGGIEAAVHKPACPVFGVGGVVR